MRLCAVCRHCGLCDGDGETGAAAGADDKTFRIITEGLMPYLPPDTHVQWASADIGIAVDIGTTTVAVSSYALAARCLLYRVSAANEQRRYGADVVSRISHALTPAGFSELHLCIISQLNRLFTSLAAGSAAPLAALQPGGIRSLQPQIRRIVVTGNTAMVSLFCGVDVSSLAAAPFTPASLFGSEYTWSELERGLADSASSASAVPHESCCPAAPDTPVYIPPCISAFVGADTVCAMLACGFAAQNPADSKAGLRMMAEIGTNCEMALTDGSHIWCTSSAAGPAFEGEGISCGMPAQEGAIAAVQLSPQKMPVCRVIGGCAAKGICGTGLIDAAVALLQAGIIDEHGTFSEKYHGRCEPASGVFITQQDIRSLQLAKAAVCAGITLLLSRAGVPAVPFELYLAGGFGTSINPASAEQIGMFPRNAEFHVHPAGNAASSGAASLLMCSSLRASAERIARSAESMNLALESDFQAAFLSSIDFPVL